MKVNLLAAKGYTNELFSIYEGGTVALYIAACTGFYDLLLTRSLVGENPFRHPLVKVKGNYRKPVNPTPRIPFTDVQALLAATRLEPISTGNYALLCLLLGGGLRRSEVLNIACGDVTEYGSMMVVKLYYTKTSAYHEQSLAPWAADGVRDYLGHLCIHGGNYNDKIFPLSKEGLHKRFKRLCWKAGIIGYSLHSCRVTAINTLVDMGFSDREVMEFSRHSTPDMIETYRRRVENPYKNPGLRLSYETEKNLQRDDNNL